MKFEEAMELQKDAIEAQNAEARENIERIRIEDELARRSAEYEARQEREAKEKRDREDAELFASMDKGRQRRREARTNDPDIYVRVVGNRQQMVKVQVAPAHKSRTAISADYLIGAAISMVITVVGFMTVLSFVGG